MCNPEVRNSLATSYITYLCVGNRSSRVRSYTGRHVSVPHTPVHHPIPVSTYSMHPEILYSSPFQMQSNHDSNCEHPKSAAYLWRLLRAAKKWAWLKGGAICEKISGKNKTGELDSLINVKFTLVGKAYK